MLLNGPSRLHEATTPLDVSFGEFRPETYARAEKYALNLRLRHREYDIAVPALLARGANEGKTLVAMAGVHGDEFEGVQAIFETFNVLNPADMRGDFLAVPVANPPAFWNGTRVSPLDGGDLARSFPGSLESGPTAALAHHLAHAVITRAALFLDLHSGGVKLCMPTLVGYDSTDLLSKQAALSFGASVVWGHSTIGPGRTISFAASCGIPWLYTEARGAGRIRPEDLAIFVRGSINLLRHLRILPGEPQRRPLEYHLLGEASVEAAVPARHQGFFVPDVSPLQRVTAEQNVGAIYDPHGRPLEVCQAPRDGVVAFVRQFPVVFVGDPLFLITSELPLATATEFGR